MTALPAQPNFSTLACADVERMAVFLRALGWPEAPESDEHHRVFQCTNGVVFGLYAAKNYEPNFGPRADGFRGFTIGVNLATPEEMNAVHARLSDVEAQRCPRSRSTRPTDSAASPSAIPRATCGTSPGSALDRDGRGRPDLVTRRPL